MKMFIAEGRFIPVGGTWVEMVRTDFLSYYYQFDSRVTSAVNLCCKYNYEFVYARMVIFLVGKLSSDNSCMVKNISKRSSGLRVRR